MAANNTSVRNFVFALQALGIKYISGFTFSLEGYQFDFLSVEATWLKQQCALQAHVELLSELKTRCEWDVADHTTKFLIFHCFFTFEVLAKVR